MSDGWADCERWCSLRIAHMKKHEASDQRDGVVCGEYMYTCCGGNIVPKCCGDEGVGICHSCASKLESERDELRGRLVLAVDRFKKAEAERDALKWVACNRYKVQRDIRHPNGYVVIGDGLTLGVGDTWNDAVLNGYGRMKRESDPLPIDDYEEDPGACGFDGKHVDIT